MLCNSSKDELFAKFLVFGNIFGFPKKFQENPAIFRGIRAQKPPKKGCFMDAELELKTLKTYNLTNTNAILMKLTTIMYLQILKTWDVRGHKRENFQNEAKNQFLGSISTIF